MIEFFIFIFIWLFLGFLKTDEYRLQRLSMKIFDIVLGITTVIILLIISIII